MWLNYLNLVTPDNFPSYPPDNLHVSLNRFNPKFSFVFLSPVQFTRIAQEKLVFGNRISKSTLLVIIYTHDAWLSM